MKISDLVVYNHYYVVCTNSIVYAEYHGAGVVHEFIFGLHATHLFMEDREIEGRVIEITKELEVYLDLFYDFG